MFDYPFSAKDQIVTLESTNTYDVTNPSTVPSLSSSTLLNRVFSPPLFDENYLPCGFLERNYNDSSMSRTAALRPGIV